MRADVRYAGLDPEVERRVRFAASGLAAHKIQATATEWDGTRCNAVVTNADDAYGQRVIDLARRQNVAIIAISRNADRNDSWATWVEPGISIAALATVMHAVLIAAAEGKAAAAIVMDAPKPAAASSQTMSSQPQMQASQSRIALVRLASSPEFAGKDVMASLNGRTVKLLPSTGRVLASTFSDLLAIRDQLCEETWDLQPLDSRTGGTYEIGASLDSLYLNSALANRARLPEFQSGLFGMRDWPDLGHATDWIDALRIVRSMQRGKISAQGLSQEIEIDLDYVNACLWSFGAAGLLQKDAMTQRAQTSHAPPKPMPGLLGRLARHFGLSRG